MIRVSEFSIQEKLEAQLHNLDMYYYLVGVIIDKEFTLLDYLNRKPSLKVNSGLPKI